MRTRRDVILENIFAPLGILVVIVSLLFVGTMATSCKSSISTEAYKAEFEQAQPLNYQLILVKSKWFNLLLLMLTKNFGICFPNFVTNELVWVYQIVL